MSNSTQWFIIGALVVALIGLAAFYYYDENTISIETGNVAPLIGSVVPA